MFQTIGTTITLLPGFWRLLLTVLLTRLSEELWEKSAVEVRISLCSLQDDIRLYQSHVTPQPGRKEAGETHLLTQETIDDYVTGSFKGLDWPSFTPDYYQTDLSRASLTYAELNTECIAGGKTFNQILFN